MKNGSGTITFFVRSMQTCSEKPFASGKTFQQLFDKTQKENMKNGLVNTYIFLREVFEGIEVVNRKVETEVVSTSQTTAKVIEYVFCK